MRARLTLSSRTLPNLWWALTLGLLSGCSATVLDLNESVLPSVPGLEPMRRELAPLRAAFNQHKDQERLMLLVSPSCGTCSDLLETIRDSWILGSTNRTAILVFQRVYPEDDEALACSHLRGLPTDRVHAFMDEQRLAASWMTQGCLPLGVGRHLVMIFPAGAEWLEEDPVPSAWCHAMRGLNGSHRIDGQGLALWLEGLGLDVAQGRR